MLRPIPAWSAIRRTTIYRSERLAQQQRPAWTRGRKAAGKKILGRFGNRGEEVVAGWNLTGKLPRAVDAIVRYPHGAQRPERRPKAPNAHACHTVERAAKDTGLSEESVLAEARTIGAVAVDARRPRSNCLGQFLIGTGEMVRSVARPSCAMQTGVRPQREQSKSSPKKMTRDQASPMRPRGSA